MSDAGEQRKPSNRSFVIEFGRLSDWQKCHLPGIHTGPGKELLAWLIGNWGEPKPLKHLLHSTTYSETTIRHLLNHFAVLGLVELRKDPDGDRQRNVMATPKLRDALEQYAGHLGRMIGSHRPK